MVKVNSILLLSLFPVLMAVSCGKQADNLSKTEGMVVFSKGEKVVSLVSCRKPNMALQVQKTSDSKYKIAFTGRVGFEKQSLGIDGSLKVTQVIPFPENRAFSAQLVRTAEDHSIFQVLEGPYGPLKLSIVRAGNGDVTFTVVGQNREVSGANVRLRPCDLVKL